MKKIFYTVVIMAMFFSLAYPQSLKWSTTYSSSGSGADEGHAIAVDVNGNCFVGGSAAINSGSSIEYPQVIKYNLSGSQQWATAFSTYSGSIEALVIDASDNIYVTGVVYKSYPHNNHSYDIFTAMYNSSGTQQWYQTYGILSTVDYGKAIDIDGSGNVYVTGTYNNALVVVKYNSSGTFQWSTSYNANGDAGEGKSIKVVSSYVYASGYVMVDDDIDCALLKLNTSDGSNAFTPVTYSHNTSGGKEDYAYDMAISSSSIFLCGQANSRDGLLLKYNTSGSLQWEHIYYNSVWDNQTQQWDTVSCQYNSLCLKNDTIIFVTGSQQHGVQSPGDYLTQEYFASSGSLQWTTTYNGSGNHSGSGSIDGALKVIYGSNKDKVYVIGSSDESSPDQPCTITTIRYSSSGSEEWHAHTTNSNNLRDEVNTKFCGAILYSGCYDADFIHITGYSETSSSVYKIFTLQYGYSGECSGFYYDNDSLLARGFYNNINEIINNVAIKNVISNGVLRIYDMLGKEVYQINNIENCNIDFGQIHMKEGIYLINISDGKTSFLSKKVFLH